MALSRNFDTSDIEGEIKKDLWENMKEHYNYLGKGNRFIKYPHEEFKIQGIPSPWQTIAWRRLIRIMGEDNFCALPLELNYTEDPYVLFEEEFIKYFDHSTNPEKLEVTFVCGYFWKYNDKKRDKMLDFVVNNLLKKGTKVIIWTQDETLEKLLDKRRKGMPDDAAKDRLQVHYVRERIDVHYTLIEDKNDGKNSRLILELPHTEAHDFRLETYLTFEKLESFGCKPEKFMGVLNSNITCWYRPHLLKRLLSLCNLALNTR